MSKWHLRWIVDPLGGFPCFHVWALYLNGELVCTWDNCTGWSRVIARTRKIVSEHVAKA